MAKSTKALEAIAALKQLRSAPSVVIPGKMTELEKAVLESKGKYGAQRVQRAADEIKNLEQQYTLDALRSAFLGDNAKALMIGKPGEFQRFAAKVDEPYRPAVEQYLREMSRQGGGAEDVPFLDINRKGPEWLPQITGHEGRHRNIAMDELGHESTLWRLLPTNDMRESMPRRSQEQFIEALRQELGLNRFVTPEGRSLLPTDLSAPEHQNLERRGLTAGNRPVLPEPFAGGGMAKGGQKVTKAVKEFIDPPSTKLQDWNWRPLEAVSKDLSLTEIPDYIQKGYGSFMADQAARAAAGDLTSRDLLKAYLITQSSIGRQGRSYNTATKAGLKVPRTDELVRPEGAFAAWLGSKSGQRYLDAAMKGELDKKAVAEIQSQFAPFGKQNVLGKAMVGAVDMVPKMAPTLNQSIMGLPDDYRDYAEQLKGIAAAKSGFVGSLLGRGDLPTFDARQIYLHTAGQPLPTKIPESILDRGKGLGGREAVDRLAARQDALGLKLDPALDPYYQHLAHHAVWDKSGNSQTTHQDLIDAMTNYKDGGKVKRRDIDEFKLLGENEAARARPFDTGYRKPEPKMTPMEKLDAILKQQGSFAAPRPHGTTVSQYEKDFRNNMAREQAEREQAVKSGLTSWVTDIPGTVADLAVDLPYYLGQRVMGRRGDNIRPLGYGERVRAELATALGLQNPPSDEVGMRPPPAHEEVTDAISLLNPIAWTVAGDPVGIARAGTKAVKSVGKALGKEAGRRIDEAMMTGEGMLGSALAPVRPNFMFIGPSAKTWNKSAAFKASQMERAGKSPEEIWAATKTFKGADGNWRQEVSDQSARFQTEADMKAKAAGMKEQELANKASIAESKLHPDLFPKQLTAAQKDLRAQTKALREERTALHGLETDPKWRGNFAKYALEHPELYEAYPELADMIVKQGLKKEGARAGLLISKPRYSGQPVGEHTSLQMYEQGLRDDPRSSALHEMQHAIQGIEGWAPGGDIGGARFHPKFQELYETRKAQAATPLSLEDYVNEALHGGTREQFIAKYGRSPEASYEGYVRDTPDFVKSIDRKLKADAAMDWYRSLAGESEARATQARRNMSMAEREQVAPTQSFTEMEYPVPMSEQIVTPPTYAHGGPVSRDAMQIKAWDKQVQHKVLGGLSKGKGVGKVIDVVTDLKSAPKVGVMPKGVPGVDYANPKNASDIMRLSEALGASGSEGKYLNLTQADRSRVFGPNKGGTGFSGLQLTSKPHQEASTTWGVGKPSHATRLINANTPDTIWTNFIGSPTQHMSNPVVVEKMYEAHGKANPSADLMERMNAMLNSAVHPKTGNLIFPMGIDVSRPDVLDAAKTFDQRKLLAQALTIGGEKRGEKATQEAFRILREETDPLLINAPTYGVGNRLWTIDSENSIYRPDLNAAFPYQVTGTDLGLIFDPAPIEIASPTFVKRFEGRLNKAGKPQPIGHKDLSATTPRELVSHQYLMNLEKEGYRDGGAVNMAEGGMISDDLIVEERPL